MLSPLAHQAAGHYFQTFDSELFGNELAAGIVGAPSYLRGTDPAGYAHNVLTEFGVLPSSPGAQGQPAGILPSLSIPKGFWTNAVVVVIGILILAIGVVVIAKGD